MKILIPILGFDRHGGYRVLSKLADAWLDLGHEVAFLIPETSSPPYFPTSAALLRSNRSGVIAEEVTLHAANRKPSGFDNLLSIYAGLNNIGNHFDVILANHSLTAWPVRLARSGTARKIYYIQAYEPEYYNICTDPVKYMLARLSYSLDLKQISNSKIYSANSGQRGVGFVPPGVDVDLFHPVNKRPLLADSQVIYLGTIGRTEPYKGTAFVLKAFEQLYKLNSRFRLRIAFGNLPTDWSHPAAEIVDIKNDKELAHFYRSLDILMVGATAQTGAPHYPVIEGMACGVPVLHTGYFPGSSENSWIVQPGESSSLVAGVLKVLASNSVEEKTTKGIDYVRNNLSWPVLAAKMLTYIAK